MWGGCAVIAPKAQGHNHFRLDFSFPNAKEKHKFRDKALYVCIGIFHTNLLIYT